MSVAEQRTRRGQEAYHGGAAAEAAVARAYVRQGYEVLKTRWRGKCGEIDLVLGHGAARIFVEVKKSRTFSDAAQRVSEKQSQRLFAAAEEFLSREPKGLLTEMRIDVALVDSRGEIDILQNALTVG